MLLHTYYLFSFWLLNGLLLGDNIKFNLLMYKFIGRARTVAQQGWIFSVKRVNGAQTLTLLTEEFCLCCLKGSSFRPGVGGRPRANHFALCCCVLFSFIL